MCIQRVKSYDHLPDVITAYKVAFRAEGELEVYIPPFFNTPFKLATYVYSEGIRKPDLGKSKVGFGPFLPNPDYEMGCHLYLEFEDAKNFFDEFCSHRVLECRVLKRDITGFGTNNSGGIETVSVTKYFPYHVMKD